MRIQDTNRLGMIQSYQKMGQKLPEKQTEKPPKHDQVQISSQAQEKLRQIQSEQTGREERIQQLKEHVDKGNYPFDSDKLADRLLSLWKKS